MGRGRERRREEARHAGLRSGIGRSRIPEILREEFLIPQALTQRQVAESLGCDVKVMNRIVNGRTSVSAEMALKLGAAFRTTPELWLNAQKAVDLHEAARHLTDLPRPLLEAS